MKKILFTLLCALLPLLGWAQENEPYAVLSDNNTVLTFYYDGQKAERNGLSVGPFSGGESSWYAQRESITSVVFDTSFAACTTLTSTSSWFYGCRNLVTISGLENLNTSNVTSMAQMFCDCVSLTSLDLGNFNTSNVTDMYEMFRCCSGFASLDLSSFDTSNVTDMREMFYDCFSLTSLNIGSFNTSNVTNMHEMFCYCRGLTVLNLGNFNTSNVTDMSSMFYGCGGLTNLDLSSFNTENVTEMGFMFSGCDSQRTIYVGEGWNTVAVTYGGGMFSDCYNLVGGKGTKYQDDHVDHIYARIDQGPDSDAPGYFTRSGDAPWVDPEAYAVLSDNNTVLTFYYDNLKAERSGTNISDYRSWVSGYSRSIATVVFDASFAGCTTLTTTAYWFSGCDNLTTIFGIENLNTSNVTDMSYMFSDCSSLTSLDVSGFNTSNVTDMSYMFYNCDDLTNLDVSGFNTENVTNMRGMFRYCSGLTSLDLSGFKMDKVTDMRDMFALCSGLTSLDLSCFKPDSVTDMSCMFYNCQGLTSLNLSGFKPDNMRSMFYNCHSLTSLDLSGFNTSNVTDMRNMFEDCSGLTSLDLSGLKTDKVTDMGGMFSGCSGLTSLDLSGFRTDNVTNMRAMFYRCSGLASLDVSGFETDNVTDMEYMFENCSGLTSLDVSGFNTKNVTDMDGMFQNCDALTSLDLSGFRTDNVTSMWCMFSGCSGLTSLDLSSFKTDKVVSIRSMFSGCSVLTTIYVGEGWTAANMGAEGSSVFSNCSNLVGGKGTVYSDSHTDYTYARIDQGPDSDAPGYFTRSGDTPWVEPEPTEAYAVLSDNNTVLTFYYDNQKAERNGMSIGPFLGPSEREWNDNCKDIASVVFDLSFASDSTLTSTAYWFWGCSNLTTISGIENLNTENVTDMKYMFVNCSSLTSLDLSTLNTKNVTNISQLFPGCSSLTSLDLSGFNTSNVTDMSYMFYGCSSLVTIYVGEGWNTSAVTEGGWMFSSCSNLVGGKGTKYDGEHADYTYARIDQGPDSEAPGYFTRSGDAPWVEPEPAEAYAVLSDSNTVLTFYYDNQKAARNGLSVGPFYSTENQSWSAEREVITTVVFDTSFAGCKTLTSTCYWFSGCSNLITISGMENLNTGNVTNMTQMFSGCSSLTRLDLSGFNTSNVTDMEIMFQGCSSLANLDLSGFNTTNVTNMCWMFNSCSGLTSLDLSSFNTSNVTDMYAMFQYCSGLTSLDLSSFNTGNVTAMGQMFYRCGGLTSLDLTAFNTGNVTNMYWMFGNCDSLTTIYVGEGWMTTNVTEGTEVFINCSNLVGGKGTKYQDDHVDHTYARIDQGPDSDAPGYFTRNGDAPWVEPEPAEAYAVLSDNNTVLTFYYDGHKAERNGLSVGPFLNFEEREWSDNCEKITSVVFDLSFANDSTITSTAFWFWNCTNLTTISGIENLKTDNVTDMSWMFGNCSGLTSLDLSTFNTSNVMNMECMFYLCQSLASLNLSNFNTSNVTNMGGMFTGCYFLRNLDLGNFNTSNVTNMSYMFNSCGSLTSLDVSGFKTDNVTDMMNMFNGCSGLTNLDLSGFNTSNVTDMSGMFSGCFSLVNLDLSSFNTENVTEMGAMSWKEGMFSGCSNLTTIYVGEGWTTANVTEGAEMFKNCSSLVGGNGTKYEASHVDHTYARIDQGPDSDAPGYFTRSGDIPWGEKSTFDGRVLTVRGSGSIDAALTQVGGFEQVDKTITAIVWEADVPYSGAAAFSNPNLLFYANDATKGQAINNLIYNGVAESITLTDEGEGNTDFYCPQSFTARSITYRRSFQQQTEIGVSRGWETIALPFTVQRISRVRSDEGQERITPFGSSEGDRHFWLRRLTANGLQSVQTIEANTPYIIAMPNSEEYAAEYNLAGDIVFTAENATVAVTEPVSDRSADYELTANFERMAAQDSIYVLNVGAPRYGYPEGSIFEAAYRDLPPFRAYTRHINNGRPAPPYFALGNLGGDNTTGISSIGDDAFATDVWYDIQGRKLQGRPTQKGVYIQNGRKVIVK